MRRIAKVLAVLAIVCLSGCSTAGYYWQSVNGHMQMLQAARPVADMLVDPQTPPELKTRLALSQRIRSFAATELLLPNNPSYTRFADLQRSAVVWNVMAAPELSLTLKTWCFAVVGCVGYRGYFNQAEAQQLAAQLKTEGLEVTVYGVPAYSTLGKLAWLGPYWADPLLNTFINTQEGDLARLVFHELAHQVVYAADDTMFNESFATAVERLGVQRWLKSHGSQKTQDDYAALELRRQQFRALTTATRRDLAKVYEPNTTQTQEIRAQAATKKVVMEQFKNNYNTLKQSWGDTALRTSGYDAWVAQANNASFAAQAAYDELVPGFIALFERQDQDWQRFYDAVRQLAALPKTERHLALKIKN